MESLGEAAQLKIKCLAHLQEVLGESKRQNTACKEECARVRGERDLAMTQLLQMREKDNNAVAADLRGSFAQSSADSAGEESNSGEVADVNEEYFNRWVTEQEQSSTVK